MDTTITVSFRPKATAQRVEVWNRNTDTRTPLGVGEIAVATLTRVEAQGLLLFLQDAIPEADRRYAEKMKAAIEG